jgi:acetoin utilization protein AcuB
MEVRMIVDMWMTHDPLCIEPSASISRAALLMTQHQVRRLVVVDRRHGEPRLVGMVAAGDVARAFPAVLNPTTAAVTDRSVRAPLKTIKAHDVRTIPSGTAIEEAAHLMQATKIGALPVVSGKRLVGIITESDVFRAFVEMSDAGTPGVRVTFDLDEDEDVTATVVDLCEQHGVRLSSILSFHHRDARTGDQRRLGVVRLPGTVPERFMDALWSSNHRVLSVVETAASPARRSA